MLEAKIWPMAMISLTLRKLGIGVKIKNGGAKNSGCDSQLNFSGISSSCSLSNIHLI